MINPFLQSIFLSFKLAFFTTIILLPIGILLAIYLASSGTKIEQKFKIILESIIWLPLVLPPSVLGYYLLVSFAPNSPLGRFLLDYFNLSFVFSFEGLVIASVIFSLPFMVNPIKTALNALPQNLIYASFSLGASRFRTYYSVVLPNIKSSIFLACVTSFAHTIGEFGVVLMIGGDIEGVTRVASIALFTEVEAANFALANNYALALTAICVALLIMIFAFANQNSRNARS